MGSRRNKRTVIDLLNDSDEESSLNAGSPRKRIRPTQKILPTATDASGSAALGRTPSTSGQSPAAPAVAPPAPVAFRQSPAASVAVQISPVAAARKASSNRKQLYWADSDNDDLDSGEEDQIQMALFMALSSSTKTTSKVHSNKAALTSSGGVHPSNRPTAKAAPSRSLNASSSEEESDGPSSPAAAIGSSLKRAASLSSDPSSSSSSDEGDTKTQNPPRIAAISSPTKRAASVDGAAGRLTRDGHDEDSGDSFSKIAASPFAKKASPVTHPSAVQSQAVVDLSSSPEKRRPATTDGDGPTCMRCTFVNSTDATACVICAAPLVATAAGLDKDSNDELVVDSDMMKLQEQLLRNVQRREKKKQRLKQGQEKEDMVLAQRLQEEEKKHGEKRKAEESKAMLTTIQGRAWVLIEKVIDMHKRLMASSNHSNLEFETVARDDMVFLAEKFVALHEQFRNEGKPITVELKYHYTQETSLSSIREGGLMSGEERASRGIATRRIEAFGTGIYTANNPIAFQHFGPVGLLVAVLKGNTARIAMGQSPASTLDSVIGNKIPTGTQLQITESHPTDEIILKKSAQVLPLIKYPTKEISQTEPDPQSAGNELLWKFHEELQKILDEAFHDGRTTKLTRIKIRVRPPPPGAAVALAAAAPFPPAAPAAPLPQPAQPLPLPTTRAAALSQQMTTMLAAGRAGQMPPPPPARGANPLPQPGMPPASFPPRSRRSVLPVSPSSQSNVLRYQAPSVADLGGSIPLDALKRVRSRDRKEEDCPICMESLNRNGVVRVKACEHQFHRQCIEKALGKTRKCPVCRVAVGEPQGSCPSGSMHMSTTPRACGGYESVGTIKIAYSMPSGTQLSIHQHPGQPYTGTTRIAYLPDNVEGRNLLKRLRYAWAHGLTFTIGTSLTTGMQNQVVWGSIHHKTSPYGGSHGFPDPFYFQNCNSELDALGVPPEQECFD